MRRRARSAASVASFVCAATFAAPAALVGCVDPDEGGEPDAFEVDPATTTSVVASSGTTAPLSYPPGPYGVTRGQIIQDFEFSGFPDPDAERSTLVTLRLGDFYNPTGDGTFDEGSPLGSGKAKPRALAIVLGAVWCSPCQEEARQDLPDQHERLTPIGGQIFFILEESSNPGVPSTKQDLVNWTKTFDNAYPSVLDPNRSMAAVVKPDTYPGNIIIDTRDMSIVDIVTGSPPDSYWDAVAALARDD